ncbi:hypothetical protein DXG01_014263 [Tephrocybe rancida]|nr:hypothetical protein DXG01_014263 [Tephrocybe rancida]
MRSNLMECLLLGGQLDVVVRTYTKGEYPRQLAATSSLVFVDAMNVIPTFTRKPEGHNKLYALESHIELSGPTLLLESYHHEQRCPIVAIVDPLDCITQLSISCLLLEEPELARVGQILNAANGTVEAIHDP